MPYTRIVLRCPCCQSTVTDPVAILAARRWKNVTDGVIQMGCLRCQKAGRPDQEMQEVQERVLVATGDDVVDELDVDLDDIVETQESGCRDHPIGCRHNGEKS